MNILEATRRYESWLLSRTMIHQRQLLRKHEVMRENAFAFLRGTFYRWAQMWPEVCSDLHAAPTVLSVADLHVENFGTWRDQEGRLVWGVNDFDEAFPLPYTNDLVRLAGSAMLAIAEKQLGLKPKEACEAILTGYMKGFEAGGRPFILDQTILENAIRSRDPFVQVREPWLLRRLSPHCCRIEMDDLPKKRDEYQLLHAMGWETANIHLGSHDSAAAIRRDVAKRKSSWLRNAAKMMIKVTTRDWKEWRKG